MLRSPHASYFFFFNDTATTEIYTLSLHALFRSGRQARSAAQPDRGQAGRRLRTAGDGVSRHHSQFGLGQRLRAALGRRSEEHTSELQSQSNLVCRLLLEKKNRNE